MNSIITLNIRVPTVTSDLSEGPSAWPTVLKQRRLFFGIITMIDADAYATSPPWDDKKKSNTY